MVVARLRLASVGYAIAVSAKKIFATREELADAALAGPTAHNAAASEIGPRSSVVAIQVD